MKRLNNLKSYALYILLATVLFSCKETHKSELMQEEGVVVAKQFRGEVNETGSSVGVTASGDMTFGTVNIHESEKFDVVFKCQHGVVFTIDNVDIYGKLKEGDNVIIDYYEIRYEDNTVKDLDFVDANRRE